MNQSAKSILGDCRVIVRVRDGYKMGLKARILGLDSASANNQICHGEWKSPNHDLSIWAELDKAAAEIPWSGDFENHGECANTATISTR